ncbi:hypothetical protein [Streptomyces specialis]|uniref:hypothetical protein n=1 Tax=Streptomyces specialis TaxID=498367 RepID=UPI00073F6A6D|nr:hypothetical protein [Streptomyces specialis]
MDRTGRYAGVCGHTHLFRGARVRVKGVTDPGSYVAAPAPMGLLVRFSDGTTADAEVVVSADGAAALGVAAHTTRAGTRIPERVWTVREFTADDGDVEAVVGERMR